MGPNHAPRRARRGPFLPIFSPRITKTRERTAFMDATVLAADIGGTKVNIALFPAHVGELVPLREKNYRTADYPDLASILDDFLAGENRTPVAAAFGVPAPIRGRIIRGVNLRWDIDRNASAARLPETSLAFLNDLVATAHAIPLLPPEQIDPINPGRPAAEGNRALIAAGTGLGQALLIRDADAWRPIPSEGGHADFSPASELEIELLQHLRPIFGRVSTERVLCGSGLHHIYTFMLKAGLGGEEPRWLRDELERNPSDPAAVITREALSGASRLCTRALDLFVEIYGAEAGDLALYGLATNAFSLDGFIAPKILPALKSGRFMHAFTNKGRMSHMLQHIPVRIILEPRAAMLGAAVFAHDHLINH